MCPRERRREQDDQSSIDAPRTASSRSRRSVGVGRDSREGDLDLKSNPLEETEIPVELGAPITKLEEETRTHDPDTDLAQLQLKTQ